MCAADKLHRVHSITVQPTRSYNNNKLGGAKKQLLISQSSRGEVKDIGRVEQVYLYNFRYVR